MPHISTDVSIDALDSTLLTTSDTEVQDTVMIVYYGYRAAGIKVRSDGY